MNSPPIYPITYKLSISSRLPMAVFSLLMLYFGIKFSLLGIKLNQSFNFGMGAFLLLVAVLIAVPLFTIKVRLYKDRIALTSFFSTRELANKDIKGFSTRIYRGNNYIELLPIDSNVKKLTISRAFNFDSHFDEWLKTLNNLDAVAEQELQQEIASDPQYGFTPEERDVRAKNVKRLNMVLTFGSIPFLLWMMFYPHPLWLAVGSVILLPWIAIMLVAFSNGYFSILGADPAALRMKCNLRELFTTPAIVFYCMSFMAIDNGLPVMPVEWTQLLVPAIFIAIIMTALVAFVSREHHAKFPYHYLLLVFALLIVDNGGSIGLLNGLFDHKDPTTYDLMVINKHSTSGRNSTYWLETSSKPEEHYNGSNSLRVPASLYSHVNVNQTICVQMHPGTFGMLWESMDACHT